MRIPVFLIVFLFGLPALVNAQDARSSVIPARHTATLKKNCFKCHNADNDEGGVNLQDLDLDLATVETAAKWQKVLGALNAGEMPPVDEPQLSAAEKTELLSDLSSRIVVARKILSDTGGVVTMRRLNRREYANTIRHLLGVEVDVQDLPDDSNSAGFDTSGASLFLSSDQFEKYLEIGRTALSNAIVFGDKPKIDIHRECEIDASKAIKNRHRKLIAQKKKIRKYRDAKGKKDPTDYGFIDTDRVEFEEGVVANQFPACDYYLNDLPDSKTGVVLLTTFGGALLDKTKVPASAPPGEYTLRIRAGYFPGSDVDRRFIEYGHSEVGAPAGEFAVVGCRAVTGTIKKPAVIEVPITIGLDSREIVLRQRSPNNRAAQRGEFRSAQAKRKPAPDPVLWIDWVELKGPHYDQWPPKSNQQLFPKGLGGKHSDEYAREVIQRFAWRAFRGKKPAPKYVDKLMGLYKAQRDSGQKFVEALKDPLSAILASPSFLYIAEPAKDATKRELTDRELAIRLSYFLWSAPPDYKLLSLAKSGELSKPQVLAEQTNRLLNDRRAMEFINSFSHQWLTMDRLDFFQFNSRLYRDFDDSVKQAARDEIYQTIKMLIRDNQPIGKLLNSDEVVINDLLADYYGIEGVSGANFRPVKVPVGVPRGGLLATAAVLAMGSDGERSSPVERGAWVMRKLLNDPPPPAPANVPQLGRLEEEQVSARQLQKLHQEEPQCAQCHRKIDPIGFGLENFDAAGRWREQEKVAIAEDASSRRKKAKSKLVDIDASGSLPDGTKFDSFESMRESIGKCEREFARGYTESLIEYGLGRPYGFSDYELATEILEQAKAQKYGMREFIHALVGSKQFRMK